MEILFTLSDGKYGLREVNFPLLKTCPVEALLSLDDWLHGKKHLSLIYRILGHHFISSAIEFVCSGTNILFITQGLIFQLSPSKAQPSLGRLVAQNDL